MLDLKLANFGIWELVLILLIVIVIFGAGKLPQLGDALGRSIRNFKKAYHDEPQEIPGQARRVEGAADQECLSPPKEGSPLKTDESSKSKGERQ
jgi:sec-independent protein translocase protein TatA